VNVILNTINGVVVVVVVVVVVRVGISEHVLDKSKMKMSTEGQLH
jgi:hypothetical protein